MRIIGVLNSPVSVFSMSEVRTLLNVTPLALAASPRRLNLFSSKISHQNTLF
jgi:hypothetical protein